MNPRLALRPRMLALLCALGPTTPTLAHMGLPETSNVTIRRAHPEDFFAGTTFGAVISRDSGHTWRWICPEAMGYGGWRPESFLWRENGSLLAATGSSLLRSLDDGCTWGTHPYFAKGGLDTWVTGLAADPTDDRILYSVTGRGTAANGVYRSDDGGETWKPTGLLRTGVLLSAVKVSAVDTKRLYVSGESGTQLLLFRSDDAGATWEELPQALPDLPRPYDLVVLATGPARVDEVWARVSSNGITYLLRSLDGGRTMAQVKAISDVVINMDLSADGATVWVGTLNSFFRGPPTGPLDPQVLPSGNACVLRQGDTLYACGSTWVHDWAMARSEDQGTTWEPLFGLYDIQGTHLCPRGTPVRDLCPSRWPQLAEQLGAPLYPDGGIDEPAPPDAGTPDAGSPQDDAGTPTDDGGVVPNPPKKSGGCGAAPGNGGGALLLLSTLLLARRGRRRAER